MRYFFKTKGKRITFKSYFDPVKTYNNLVWVDVFDWILFAMICGIVLGAEAFLIFGK